METASTDRWWFKPSLLSLASGGLLWLAFPPLGLAPLAWFALIPLLVLVLSPTMPASRWRWYLAIWLTWTIHWLLMVEGVRHAHWTIYFGWLVLSCYLAVYMVLFVGLTRVALHRCRWPLILAAPLVWTGLELARGYALSGFSLGLLAHTQVKISGLIQLADVTGAYGISFLIVLVNSALAQAHCTPGRSSHSRQQILQGWATALLTVALMWGYGALASRDSSSHDDSDSCQIALLQAAIDTTYAGDDNQSRRMHEDYRRLSIEARQQYPELDLIVWPESMFPFGPEVIHQGDPVVPAELAIDKAEFVERVAAYQLYFQAAVDDLVGTINGPGRDQSRVQFLLGTDVQKVDTPRTTRYNAGLLIDADGQVRQRYFKQHLVLFGEYIPLGGIFPWLYSLTPMSYAVSRGQSPSLFTVKGVRLCPNICFESIVPHFTRNQLKQLGQQGTPPHAIINISNDGWFRGSSILDLHLACSVFRAVELRIPMLVAANTGLSAVIDRNGTIQQLATRRHEEILVTSVQATVDTSFYRKWGDLFAFPCLLACLFLAIMGSRRREIGLDQKRQAE